MSASHRGRPCSSLRLWDPRQGAGAPAAQVALPGKAYSASVGGVRLVVAMSGRHVDIFDLRTCAWLSSYVFAFVVCFWGGRGGGWPLGIFQDD
jgi:hypothetical protein